MSCLEATFTLTPRSPYYNPGPRQQSWIWCFGSEFLPFAPYDFSSLYAADNFFFEQFSAGDPATDYTPYPSRQKVPFLEAFVDMTAFATAKQLALIFGFATLAGGRVLVYTDAGKISDQTLAPTDNQFLLEIESLDSAFWLYFIHAGGDWFFKGLSGYVV